MNNSVKTLQTMIVNSGVKIEIDGDLGPETRGAIAGLNIPFWLKLGLAEIGTEEIHGPLHEPRVIYYHSFTAGKYTKDEIAWCGSFVAMCMERSGYDLPKYPERALSWLNFGHNGDRPRVGSIAVKGRKGGGHVGIVVSVEGDYIYLLGGNQNDEVNIKKYKIADFIDFRIPKDYSNYYTNLKVTSDKAGREA